MGGGRQNLGKEKRIIEVKAALAAGRMGRYGRKFAKEGGKRFLETSNATTNADQNGGTSIRKEGGQK